MQRYQGKRGTILGPGCRDQIKQRVAGRLRFGCRCRPASFWIGRNPEKAEGLTRAFSGHTKCASTACSRLGGARRKTRTSGLPSAIAGPFGAAPKRPLRVAPTRRSGAGASEGFPEDRLPTRADTAKPYRCPCCTSSSQCVAATDGHTVEILVVCSVIPN